MVASSGALIVLLVAGIGLFARGPLRTDKPSTLASQAGGKSLVTTAAPEVAGGSAGAANVPSEVGGARASGGSASTSEGAAAAAPGPAYDSGLTKQAAPKFTTTLLVKKRSVGRGSDLTLKVCNQGDASASRTFRTVQRYDFEVDRAKTKVWQWSHDTSFAQTTGTVVWKVHECKSWTETWDAMDNNGAPVPPGTYSAYGWMPGYQQERSGVSFCVDVCS